MRHCRHDGWLNPISPRRRVVSQRSRSARDAVAPLYELITPVHAGFPETRLKWVDVCSPLRGDICGSACHVFAGAFVVTVSGSAAGGGHQEQAVPRFISMPSSHEVGDLANFS